ncbi:MAG: crotonase/enoyl-CoA hydratase family protein [bacterium]
MPSNPPLRFGNVLYQTDARVATITLNRPQRFNAIDAEMPGNIAAAFEHAGRDDSVHVIVLRGAGRGFCGGYDLNLFAAQTGGDNPVAQEMPWDAMIDYRFISRCTQDFMSIWRCPKPVIARVHGDAVAGGSDIALCCDIVVMSNKARIGYPPARVWGCPTTAMWVYRLGAERAKQLLFSGDLISGKRAAKIGLIFKATPLSKLDHAVAALTERIQGVPKNQLMMMKLLVNQAYENMGLANTQTIATLFDGLARHSPEGVHFKRRAQQSGFKQAIAERDSGAPIGGGKK